MAWMLAARKQKVAADERKREEAGASKLYIFGPTPVGWLCLWD